MTDEAGGHELIDGGGWLAQYSSRNDTSRHIKMIIKGTCNGILQNNFGPDGLIELNM